VILRNDLSRERALELVCDTEGEVDLLTTVHPEEANRVRSSPHARLVCVNEIRAMVGIIDRDAHDLPLADVRVRRALNLAIDRARLAHEGFHGFATPLSGLVPPTRLTLAQRAPDRLQAHPHDPARARVLWDEARAPADRTLRLAAAAHLQAAARRVAADLEQALPVHVELTMLSPSEHADTRRALAEQRRPRSWHVLLWEHVAQAVDSIGAELHRAFAASDGEYRAGPPLPEVDRRLDELTRQISPTRQMLTVGQIDRIVIDQAPVLVLCSPQKLYAVNREVRFEPYSSSFELAETDVTSQHWSRQG